MKKKKLLIFIFLMCIGIFMPTRVLAKNAWSVYNTNIDYQFFVDEEENNQGNLKFKLYDKTGSLSYESEYDSATKSYHFFVDENNYGIYYEIQNDGIYYNAMFINNVDNVFDGIKDYIPYSDELQNLNTFNDLKNFLEDTRLNSRWKNYGVYFTEPPTDKYGNDDNNEGPGLGDLYEFNIYTYIPMVLDVVDNNDNSILKKIVFASINIRCEAFYNMDNPYYRNTGYDKYYIGISLINNTNHWNDENQYIFGSAFLENVDFMRKTILDYSDELWEELNNGPIASREINTNNIGYNNLNYLNQRISNGERNVSEETLEDYATSLPVLNFRKSNNTNNDGNNNTNSIVDIITNPKTWNNGMIILVISMIVIIGSGIFIIHKKGSM